MPALQIFGKGGPGVTFGNAEVQRHPLGHQVEIVDVVVDEMKEVADLLIGGGLGKGVRAAELVVEARELLAVAPIGLMAGDQGMHEAGGILDDQLQFLQARRIGIKNGIGQRLQERREQAVIVPRGDRSDVDLEFFRQ